ncbi:MAG: hypothetical protein BWX84_00982 [Verrucomicrobia bacterium ADurb.Bin118]|nr:MAG: hypothetical protein BWX84_00982 [Verrucomicrobia bacterium ADurb.Bin118]
MRRQLSFRRRFFSQISKIIAHENRFQCQRRLRALVRGNISIENTNHLGNNVV